MKYISRSKVNRSKCNHAIDLTGQSIEFMLSAKHDQRAAKRLLSKALKLAHGQLPKVINVDKNAADPSAIDELKTEKILDKTYSLW